MQSAKQRFSFLLVVLLACLAGAVQAEEKLLDRVIAIVNDGVILQSDLENRMLTVKSRLSAQGTPLPPDEVLRERVLDQLILDRIQLQEAEAAGMRISDTQLNQTVSNIAARNGYTLEEFEQALASEGLTYREAREQIRQEMLISRVQQRQVDSRVRITDREVQNFLDSRAGLGRSSAEYLIGHILVQVEDFNDEAAVAEARAEAEQVLDELRSGADFQQMAVAHSDGAKALEGGVLGWRRESRLPSLIADVAPSLDIGAPSRILTSQSGFHIVTVLDKRGGQEQTVQQSLVRHILVSPDNLTTEAEAEAEIRGMYQQIREGADFAELAREHSDDPVSGSAGGSLGWVNPGEMVPAFEEAMQTAETGQVTQPFRSRFGWHILEVQDRRMRDMSEELQTAEARQVLYQRKYDIELRAWLREIREEAFVEMKIPGPKSSNESAPDESAPTDDEEAA